MFYTYFVVAFIWQPWNTEHLARHGATPELAEAVFYAPDFQARPMNPPRWEGFGTVDGKSWKVAYIRSGEAELYVLTCFRIHPSRRR